MTLIRICLIAILFNLPVSVFAQTPSRSARPDQNTIVVDSSGMNYPYAVWLTLMKSGDYKLEPKIEGGKAGPVFLLTKLTEEMKLQRNERMGKPRETPYFKTGAPFADFSYRDLNNKRYKLKEMKGKVIVLNFWFINCPPCRQEIPELNKLVERYKANEEIVFLAVALDDSFSLKEFLKKTPFNYNIIPDGRYYSQSYGVKGFPTHVVLDRNGDITFHTQGLAPNTVYWVERSIQEGISKGG